MFPLSFTITSYYHFYQQKIYEKSGIRFIWIMLALRFFWVNIKRWV